MPFASHNRLPLDLLAALDCSFLINPLNRRLSQDELISFMGDTRVLIAGTETISRRVIESAPRLGLIARVGVGLDNVDLQAARDNGVQVTFTPDAPAPAVADLTIGLILALLRQTHTANDLLHGGEWHRLMGRRIGDTTVGVIGVGRIGSRVIELLNSLGVHHILANDHEPSLTSVSKRNVEWVEKAELISNSDVLTVHVPLNKATRNMIGKSELQAMKPDAVLINTARGGIVNESDLAEVLTAGHLSGAAIDVFEQEPYSGPLIGIRRCLLTCHMGSMSRDCRSQMEIEATEEAIRYLQSQYVKAPVPEMEYENQLQA